MSSLTVCRVCLAMDVRVHRIEGSLQLVFEKLTSTALHTADGRPIVVCYICYAQLKKCRKLMMISAKAENVLSDMLQRYSKITLQSISQADRLANGLCGSLTCSVIQYVDTQLPDPIKIKTELESDVAGMEIEEPDGSNPTSEVASFNVYDVKLDIGENGPLCPVLDGVKNVNVEQEIEERGGTDSEQISEELENGCITKRKLREPRREPSSRADRGPHQCNGCRRQYKTYLNLLKHSKIHTSADEKPYECDICKCRLSKKRHLIGHFRLHTGEKPFQCNVCQKRFNQSPHLKSHLRTHTGEKPYECDVCRRKFARKDRLILHSYVHSGEKPIKCDICERRFFKKADLVRHMTSHTGEKPYECDICHHQFGQKDSLTRHKKTHTDDKQYKCEICSHSFGRKSSLSRHVKTHSKRRCRNKSDAKTKEEMPY